MGRRGTVPLTITLKVQPSGQLARKLRPLLKRIVAVEDVKFKGKVLHISVTEVDGLVRQTKEAVNREVCSVLANVAPDLR